MANWRTHSNLECFLSCTTPTMPAHSLPKTCIPDLNNLWQPIGKDTVEYFTLRDLWDHYYEWSAYGAGVRILLSSGETVVQYYVPYLSAIQIYTSKSLAASRSAGEESESDSWSDDSESEKLSRSLSNSSRTWDAISEDSALEQEGFWPIRDRLGHLYFQYFESCSPYGRIPLMDKVTELARNYPGLTSFKSVDLSPASWMAVAWYPIYHIPSTRRNVKGLSACFLTYHTISSSFQDNTPEDWEKDICTESGKNIKNRKGASNSISLPPFGLATYKMQGNLWMNPETPDHEKFVSLLSAADSWLKQLRVQHHDYNFFTARSM